MNKSLDQIRAAEATLLLPTYERNPLLFVEGVGVYLEDEHGTKYLDLLSGIGVNASSIPRTSSTIPARPSSRCASPR